MKKTALAAIPAFCLVLSQTALADIPSIVSKDTSEVVTLGEYKGLELTKEVPEITDEEINARIETTLSENPEDAGDGPVETGDIATIDYEGKKDGVAFEGGTSEGYPLEIGSGSFIPGFEDGVIGMMKGETKDIPLTFPEEYHSEELAGQDVVFTVTVQSISRTPVLSDEWVKNSTDAQTVDEYREQVKAELQEEADAAAESSLRDQAFQLILNGSEFTDLPDEDVQFGIDYEKQSAEQMAAYYGMEMKDMIEAMGYTEESFEEECREYGENQAKVFYILQGVLDQEGIVVTDADAEEILANYMEAYGAETISDLKETVGEEAVDRAAVTETAMKFILDNAVITETEAAPEEAAAEEVTEAAPEEAEDAEEVTEAAPEEAEAAEEVTEAEASEETTAAAE